MKLNKQQDSVKDLSMWYFSTSFCHFMCFLDLKKILILFGASKNYTGMSVA